LLRAQKQDGGIGNEYYRVEAKYGKWDDVSQLDTNAINKIIQEKKWDNKLIDSLEEYVKLEKTKRLYLSKIKIN